MNFKNIYFLNILWFLLPSTVIEKTYAQQEKLRFEHLGVEQGLADNTVINLMKDRKGYLWFGTWNGLNKYDGYSFTSYQYEPADTTSIGGNVITHVWEDKDGLIWVVARGTGMFTFDRLTEKFISFKPKAPVKLFSVKGINEDSEGKIWLSDNEGELGRFDKRTGKFINSDLKINFLHDPDVNTPAIFEKISMDRDSALWIAGNKGLHKVSIIPGSRSKPSQLRFTCYMNDPENPNSLSSNQTRCTYQDRSGMIWVGTRMGLNRLNQKTGEVTRYLYDAGNSGSISNNDIYDILEDKQGNIWVGTRMGLNKMTRGNSEFTHYFHDDNDPTSLSNNFIMSMIIDSSDIIWAATVGGGISKLDLNQKPIALYQNNPIDSNSLSNNKVSAICEDWLGTVWIGTIGGGLNAWSKKTNKFIHYRNNPLDSSSLGSNFVSAIIEDRDSSLWIATGKNKIGILSRLDRKTNKFIHYTFKYKFQNLNFNPILTLYEDKNGVIWIGTSNGIIRFDRKTETWKHYPHDPNNPEGISDYWANAICEDDKGKLWIGPNSNALNKFNPETGKCIHYIHDPHDSGSISSSIVKSIYKDSKGTLWFATRHGGLCSFNSEKETFKTFSKRDGLPSNTVYSILEDNDGDLWMTTNKGLSRFSPSTHTFANYDVNDGLQSNQFEVEVESAGACFKGRDGTLYFGGPHGFNAFNPRDLKSNLKPTVVVITQFRLYEKVVPGKHEEKKIDLNYNENFFSFEFAALNYTSSSKCQYAYQLIGIDKDWVYSGTRRTIDYTNLGPGEYTFRVKASNNDGAWNEKGTSIIVIIHPPWWHSWWFYLLCILAFASIVYLFVRIYTERKLEKQRIILEKKQAIELERMRISSELHDDVGGELSTIRLLSEINVINTNSQQQLSKISSTSGELVKKMNEIVWALNMNNDTLQSLLAYMRSYAMKYLDDMGLDCHFEQPEFIPDYPLDGNTRRNIFLLIKEALNNVVKHAQASEVAICVTIKDGLQVSIHDNGTGIRAEERANGFGNGLRNMQQRVKELKGHFEIKNHQGTLLFFQLPVWKNDTKL